MKDLDQFLQGIYRSSFSTEPYVKRVPKPWGFELHFVPEDRPYMMKILHINEGKRLSLQVHDEKIESWVVHRGTVAVELENAKGEMETIQLKEGMGYSTHIGQAHRLVGVTDCEVFEASTPEHGTTWRLEDDYQRPNETEEMRHDPNRGWNEA